MCVPEASVYEDHYIVFWKDQIWTTGITAVTHSETKTCSVQCGTDLLFNGSILSADVRHYRMTLRRGDGATMPATAKGNCPVTMNFAIPEVPADLYNDFITDVDRTKVEA